MVLSFKFLFMLFIFYAFIGWLLEVIESFIMHKRFINRGFFIGPICPIYGVGFVLLYILLRKELAEPIGLFLKIMVICAVLEYFTSLIMEKVFKARWWDYSRFRFNINGRVCLETMVPFALFGMLVLYFVNPFIIRLVDRINPIILNIGFIFLLISFILDMVVTFKLFYNVKNITKTVAKDGSEEISKKVREELMKKSILYRRIVSAFPKAKAMIKEINERIKEEIRLRNED